MNLNLGSGQRPFGAGWENIDAQLRWKEPTEAAGGVFVCATAEYYLQGCPDDSIDTICLHHVIEHYGCNEAAELVTASHRSLKPGGSLLVFVPDMRVLAQKWLVGQLDTETYMITVWGAFMGAEEDRHKFGFDAESLRKFLQCAPWSKIVPFDWRKIEGADIARADWILGMEAVK